MQGGLRAFRLRLGCRGMALLSSFHLELHTQTSLTTTHSQASKRLCSQYKHHHA